MLKLLVDTQLPPLLYEFLQEQEINARHTAVHYPDGYLLNDNQIIKIAIEEKRTVVTKDKDFLNYYFLKGAPPKVLLIKLGNINNFSLIEYFQNNLTLIKAALVKNNSDLVILEKNQIICYK